MTRAKNLRLNPVKYETFLHRLWAIGEEGRSSIQRVTASPIVSQARVHGLVLHRGWHVIPACSGHLRFAAACETR